MIDVVADVIAVLDADDALITAQNADIQAQIDALMAQLVANTERQADIARFRALADSITSGAVYGSVVVPASPVLDQATTTPLISGITGVAE